MVQNPNNLHSGNDCPKIYINHRKCAIRSLLRAHLDAWFAQFVNNCLGGGLKSQAGCDLLVQFSNCESGFQNNGPLSIT